MLMGANTTGPRQGWSEGMNPDYSEPDSALSSSERRAPTPESHEPNSDLERTENTLHQLNSERTVVVIYIYIK